MGDSPLWQAAEATGKVCEGAGVQAMDDGG
jgi:hypothetical protein